VSATSISAASNESSPRRSSSLGSAGVARGGTRIID
jgi:hypothetical protein